jgi:hypothetical protein
MSVPKKHLIFAGVIGLIAIASAGVFTWWLMNERHRKEQAAQIAAQGAPAGMPITLAHATVPCDNVIEELRFPDTETTVHPLVISPLGGAKIQPHPTAPQVQNAPR